MDQDLSQPWQNTTAMTSSMSSNPASQSSFIPEDVGPRERLPLRTVPLSILLQTFLVFVVMIVAASVSALILSYAINTINPITLKYCRAVSKDVADGAALTLTDSLQAINLAHNLTMYDPSITVPDILITGQEITNWMYQTFDYANQSHYISVTSMRILKIIERKKDCPILERKLPTCFDETLTKLEGHADYNSIELEKNTATSMYGSYDAEQWDTLLNLMKETVKAPVWTGLYNSFGRFVGVEVSYNSDTGKGIFRIDYNASYLEALMTDVSNLDYYSNVGDDRQLHPEVGVFDVKNRKWMVTSTNPDALMKIPVVNLPQKIDEKCTGFYSDEVWHFAQCLPVSLPGVNMTMVVVSILSQPVVMSQLYTAVRDVVLLSGSALVAILFFSAFLVRFIARPFTVLSKRMKEVSAMKLENGANMERARFRELDEMQTAFQEMVRQLEQLKQYLPDSVEDGIDGKSNAEMSDAPSSPLAGAAEPTLTMHSVPCDLTYMSRKLEGLVKYRIEFPFFYAENEPKMFPELVRQCLEAVNEHPFQEVAIKAVVPGEQLPLSVQSTRQLEDILVMSPFRLTIEMTKSNHKNLLTPVMALVDTINVITTLYFTSTVLGADDDDKKISGTTFVFLYFFALIGNLIICFMLLRTASESERMHRWIGQAYSEVIITLLLSMFNTQNLQLLWSGFRFRKLLRFNAPTNHELLRQCVVWSLFGFLFCDMMQLSFKVYISQKSGISALNVVSILTSSLSLMFNMIKKVTVLWIWERGSGVAETTMVTTRTRHGGNDTRSCVLSLKFVSSLYILMRQWHEMVPAALHTAHELNRLYDVVFEIVKRHMGVVITFINGEILVAFNAVRAHATHTHDAIMCALEIQDVLQRKGIAVVCVLSCDRIPVGTLGSSSRRCFHCFAQVTRLHRIATYSSWVNSDVLCTDSMANELRSNINHQPFHLQQIDKLLDRADSGIHEVRRLHRIERMEVQQVPIRYRAIAKLISAIGVSATSGFRVVDRLVTDIKSRLRKTERAAEAESRAMELAAAAEMRNAKPTPTSATVTKLLGNIQQGNRKIRAVPKIVL